MVEPGFAPGIDIYFWAVCRGNSVLSPKPNLEGTPQKRKKEKPIYNFSSDKNVNFSPR